MRELPQEYQAKAINPAAVRLLTATHVERSGDYKRYVAELLGTKREREIDRRLSTKREQLTFPDIERVVYGLEPRPPPPPRERRLKRAFSLSQPTAALPPVGQPESRLDLTTLTTTVNIPSRSNRSYDELVDVLDPQRWDTSSFWNESCRVELDEATHTFSKLPNPAPTAVPGDRSWKGYFFEHVEWNWNLSTIASFRTFLNVRFAVDPNKHTIELDFSLHSCEGSTLYAEVNNRGVDIDWGFQRVSSLADNGKAPWKLTTQKNVRFSDTLNRRTPFEGMMGSGQILSYMAPALVGLWMKDLLESLNL